MQSFINFFMIFAVSLAAHVSVYSDYRYFIEHPVVPKVPCFFFGYHLQDLLYMHIFITNKPPSVTGIDVIYQYLHEEETVATSKFDEQYTGKEYYWVWIVLKYPEMKISLKLYKSHELCSTIRVAKGMDVATANNKITKKTYRDNYICLQAAIPCVLLVDLKHECEGDPAVTDRNMKTTTAKPVMVSERSNNSSFNSNVLTSPHYENIGKTINDTESDRQPYSQNVLIYVIISTIVMCVIILVTYLFVKTKYCHRKSHPVETMEINTYAAVNEVVYADLSLIPGDSQPPRHKEESPYAQIIGVMKPVDGKTINK